MRPSELSKNLNVYEEQCTVRPQSERRLVADCRSVPVGGDAEPLCATRGHCGPGDEMAPSSVIRTVFQC
ncbi:unnamed protein product [Gadus morhua 'NCC']